MEDGKVLEGYFMSGVNQEYGIFLCQGSLDVQIVEYLFIGMCLCILFNYVCVIGVQYQEYQVIVIDGSVVIWLCFNGW